MIRVIFLALLLAGCAPADIPKVDQTVQEIPRDLPATAPIPVEEAVVSDQPLPEAVEAVSSVVAEPLLATQAALEDLAPAQPPPEPRDAACRRAAASLIIRWEVTSPAFYRKRLLYPIWPGGSSGITWGIGYDGGHQTREIILDDWQTHDGKTRLSNSAGISGKAASNILRDYRDIPTAFDYASRVFEDRSLIEYERRTRRAFGDEHFDALKPEACAGLVSLVYNRGAAMTGDSRREMRNIRDCVPKQDYPCIARELRSMTRLWRGTVNEKGLAARREAEAILVETN